MTKIIPLNQNIHGNTRVKQSNDYSRFKDQFVIPLVVQDFVPLASEFPIVFLKNAETGEFLPAAMMGLKKGVNAYCQTAEWEAPVRPLGFKNAPLSLSVVNENKEDLFVCIDEDSDLVSDSEGELLFNTDGTETEFLKQRKDTLLNMVSFQEQTRAITDYFVQNKLLTSRQLTVNLKSEDKPVQIDGIYLIDENKIKDLPDDTFNELRKKGLLPLIYAHIHSLQQVGRLVSKHNSLT